MARSPNGRSKQPEPPPRPATPSAMTETAAGAIEYLDRLLVCRLRAINARVHRYKPGFRLRQQVTPSPRLIMVRSGRVDYHVDTDHWTLEAGEMVLLPAYFQRSWT